MDDSYTDEKVFLQYHQDALTKERFNQIVKIKRPFDQIRFDKINFHYLMNKLADRVRRREFNKVYGDEIESVTQVLNDKVNMGEISKRQAKELFTDFQGKLFTVLALDVFPYLFFDETNDDYNFYHSNFKEEQIDDIIRDYTPKLIGKTMVIGNKNYTFDSLIKVPKVVNGDKTLIWLQCKLVGSSADDLKYFPIGRIIDSFIEAGERAGII